MKGSRCAVSLPDGACPEMQVDSFSYGVVLWELITKERSRRGNWRPVQVPEECPAEVDALLRVSVKMHGSWGPMLTLSRGLVAGVSPLINQ